MSDFGNGWGNGPPGWGPPPAQGYGPPPQASYGAAPQQQGYGPPPQQGYGPPPQQGYGPPPGYGPQAMAPYPAMMPMAWACRFCGYQGYPMQRRKVSTGGIIVAVVLFFVFFPLFWIGLLMKDTVTSCPQCQRQSF